MRTIPHRRTTLAVAIRSAGGGGVVMGSGVDLRPVILGQPAVSGSSTAMALPPLVVSGSVTWTIEWLVGQMATAAADGVVVATGLSATFGPAHTLMQVWLRCSATINGTPQTYYSSLNGRQWIHPAAGMTADNAGCPVWAAHTSDPDGAAAWSATTLYKTGDVVTHGGNNWWCQDMYSYGVTPGTDSTKWAQLVQALYLDVTAGSNGTGTKASPFNNPLEFQTRCSSRASGTKAATGTAFLVKRGTTVATQFYPESNTGAKLYLFGCYGASGARPIIIPEIAQDWMTALSIFTPPAAALQVQSANLSGARFVDLDIDGDARYMLNVATGSITGSFTVGQAATLGVLSGTVVSVVTHNAGASTYVLFKSLSRDLYLNGAASLLTTATGSATMTVQSMMGLTSQAGNVGSIATNVGVRSVRAQRCTNSGIAPRGAVSGYVTGHFAHECEVTDCCHDPVAGTGGLMWEHAEGYRLFFNSLTDNGHANTIHNHQTYCSWAKDSCILFSRFGNSRTSGTYGNHAIVYHGTASNLDVGWNFVDRCKSGFGFNDGYEPETGAEIATDLRFIGNKMVGVDGDNSFEIAAFERVTAVNNILVDSAPAYFYGHRAAGGDTSSTTGDSKLVDALVVGNTFVRTSLVFGGYALTRGENIERLREHNNVIFDKSVGASWLPYMVSNTVPLGEIAGSSHGAAYIASGNVARYGTLASGTDYATLAALNAAQTVIAATSLSSNPMLTNTTAGSVNALPQAGSPLIASGIDMRRYTGAGCDFAGVERPATPARGALEPA